MNASENERLRQLLKVLLFKKRDDLKKFEKDLPKENRVRINRPRSGYTEKNTSEEIDWDLSVIAVKTNTKSTEFLELLAFVKSTKELKDAFLVDASGKALLDEEQVAWFSSNNLPSQFMAYYFQKAQSFRFKPSIFAEAFSIVESKIKKEDHTGNVVCPIENLRIDSRHIVIEPGLVLRKISDDEREVWLSSESTPSKGDNFASYDCAVEVAFTKSESKTGSTPIEERHIIRNLLQVIELVLGTQMQTIFLDERISNEFKTRPWITDWINGTRYVGTGHLDNKRRKQVLAVWKEVKKKKKIRPLLLALSRWSSSRNRESSEDRILDNWIALEALFGFGAGSVRNTVSARASCFLGRNAKQRKYMYSMLKRSYDLRSAVAHGRKFDERQNLTILNETGTCIQTAIYNFLINPNINTTADLEHLADKIDIDMIESGTKGRRVGYLL